MYKCGSIPGDLENHYKHKRRPISDEDGVSMNAVM